jgi:hypothetical protein
MEILSAEIMSRECGQRMKKGYSFSMVDDVLTFLRTRVTFRYQQHLAGNLSTHHNVRGPCHLD